MKRVSNKIKVALVSTSDLNGGAAIACYRLGEALQKSDEIEACLLVKEKRSDSDFVKTIHSNKIGKYRGDLNFALEKGTFLRNESSKSTRFLFSNPNFGQNISKMDEIKEADIIHFHWINKGFLSLKNLNQLAALNKPIVWTLHDMWAFTGGCHYVEHCENFKDNCGHCFLLRKSAEKDLSHQLWNKKNALYKKMNLHIVTSSVWLKEAAQSSSLLKNYPIIDIPSTLDTSVFKPQKKEKKDHYSILFQAMNINDERKGLKFFLEALKIIKANYPEFASKVRLLVFGKNKSNALDGLDYPVDYLGFVSGQQEIANAYNRSDIFVIPSLGDNLPNSIIESMATGKPVVGFDVGGIPEMIDHKINGYLAPVKDSKELAEGIKWTLENDERYTELSKNALIKVEKSYSQTAINEKYEQLYSSILKGVD